MQHGKEQELALKQSHQDFLINLDLTGGYRLVHPRIEEGRRGMSAVVQFLNQRQAHVQATKAKNTYPGRTSIAILGETSSGDTYAVRNRDGRVLVRFGPKANWWVYRPEKWHPTLDGQMEPEALLKTLDSWQKGGIPEDRLQEVDLVYPVTTPFGSNF